MSVLASLKLTPERVRAMTGSKPTLAPRSNPKARGTMKRTCPAWIWNWLLKLEAGTKFTLTTITQECGKKRTTAQVAISLAIHKGLAKRVSTGNGGPGLTLFIRTDATQEPQAGEKQTFARVRKIKPGTMLDYRTLDAVSEQAAIHILRRCEEAGLVRRVERVKAETVYRRTAK